MKRIILFLLTLANLLPTAYKFKYQKEEVCAKAQEYAIFENYKDIDEMFSHKISIDSESAYLMDYTTGTVLYSKNETVKKTIASMCKVMTLLICFEKEAEGVISFDDTITVSERASSMGGSQVFLEANKEYKINELIKSIVVASANDASVAMAEHIAGSEELFVDIMNEKCKELSMENTVFTNATGLPKEGQFSCAKDVAKMFSELLKYDKYYNFSKIWMDKIYHDEEKFTEIANTNKLVRYYDGCDSGKTGYTSESGHCLTASAKRNGMRLISVIIKAPSSKTRFADCSNLFNYGFANFENKMIIDNKKPLDVKITVENGKIDVIKVQAEKPFFSFGIKGKKDSFDVDFIPNKKVIAPINVGDCVGKLEIYKDSVLIGEVNVVSMENVEKEGFFDVVTKIIKNWQI